MVNDSLSIGFIGAGRVGMTLGRCFYEKNLQLSGYYSKTYENAQQAAEFTCSRAYKSVKALSDETDIIFITVPDSCIYNVYCSLCEYDLKDKILCHCSGALSASVFENIEMLGAYGYSVHPAFAVSDKMNSYKQMPGSAFFTVEGNRDKIQVVTGLLERLGNPYQIIDADCKYKYHASLAMASNLAVALYRISCRMLEECGFSSDSAECVINPLFLNNAENICKSGSLAALTGPVDRNDVSTVKEHLSVLDDDAKLLYRLLSLELIRAARQKYPNRNYDELESLLGDNI